MNTTRSRRPAFIPLMGLALAAAACGGSTGPTAPTALSLSPLPVANETADFRFHYAPGDTVDAAWQQRYHAWAIARLGVNLPQKIDYYKYQSRQDMGAHTGRDNTNGYADPARFEIHTLWPTDNHEVVHVYTALVGRPSDLFNEGIAVALQTNPPAGQFDSVFNGQEVHRACRQYLQDGTLIVPPSRIVATADFRAVSDSVLSYREAGSFVRFVLDRYGVQPTMAFFRVSARTDDVTTIRTRFQATFGESLDAAENAWLAMLRASS